METQPRSLNTLYKLLWEQIKDQEIFGLITESSLLRIKGFISHEEEIIIDKNIILNGYFDFKSSDKKEFVQRMIKETENDN